MNKFILPENIKHILNEKYLLNERYILNEAGTQPVIDVCQQAIDAIKTKLNTAEYANLNTWKDKFHTKWDAMLKKAKNAVKPADLTKIEKQINSELQVAAIRQYISRYLELFRKRISVSSPSEAEKTINEYPALSRNYYTLKAVSNGESFAGQKLDNITEIKNVFNDFARAIKSSKIFLADTTAKTIASFDEALSKLATWVNSVTDLISKSENGIKLDAATDDKIKALTAAITAVNNDEEFIDPAKLISGIDTQTQLTTAQKNFTSISSISLDAWTKAANDLAALQTDADRTAEDEKQLTDLNNKISTNKTDWAKAFDAAAKSGDTKQIDNLWEQYYKEVWGKHASKVKALGTTLTNLLLDPSYGFEPSTNHWLVYIKYCFDNGYNLTRDNFYAVLQSGNYIPLMSLTRSDTLSKNNVNILYCKNLYTLDSGVIKNYLAVQYKIYSNGKNATSKYDTDFATLSGKNKFINDTLTAAYTGSTDKAACFMTSLFDASYNALTKRATTPTDFTNMTLKDIRLIYQEFNACFGDEYDGEKETKTEITDTDIVNLVHGQSADTIQKLLYYLYIKYSLATKVNLYNIIRPYLPTSALAISSTDVDNFNRALATIKISNIVETINKILKQAKAEKIAGFDAVP